MEGIIPAVLAAQDDTKVVSSAVLDSMMPATPWSDVVRQPTAWGHADCPDDKWQSLWESERPGMPD